MREIPHSPVALYEVAYLFGTLIAETILASVPVRARKQAGHMGASDLINAPAKHLARRGPSTYGEWRSKASRDEGINPDEGHKDLKTGARYDSKRPSLGTRSCAPLIKKRPGVHGGVHGGDTGR